MTITDELRKWAGGYGLRAGMSLRTARGQALAIADRIDSEHERQLEVLYRDMSDAEYVRLPVNVDGETIHIGDEMVLQHEAAEKPYTVQSLTWDGEDWYFTCDEGFFNACGWMHHRAPTVEDVLVKMLEKAVGYSDAHTTVALNAIAEYAAKLRLAGDAE